MAKRVNYLNNKDMLKEIHKSKAAYCVFQSSEYADYDAIIYSLDEISTMLAPRTVIEVVDGYETVVTLLPEAKVLRAKRLSVIAQDANIVDGKKVRTDEVSVSPEDINDTDIVFRLMSWDHIPEAPASIPKVIKGKKLAKVIIDEEVNVLETEYDEDLPEVVAPSPKYVKVNFPPFQHYIVKDVDGEKTLVCVGKSHWIGDLQSGSFSKDHGKITNKLALMYMKLCERYATRSNWRGYTYNDEMRSQALLQLSQIGLQFDEAKSQNPFAYYTAAITNSFTRVLNIEKRNQNIRDDILEMNSLTPSYTRQNSGGDHYNGGGEE